jgi:hypothetical protein
VSLPEQVTQHVETATLELVRPFWGLPRIASLLASFTEQIQALEDDLFQIMIDRELPEADLVRLKVLGRIIGQPRFGLSEEAYRTVLEARGLANVSKGTARDVRAAIDVLLGGPNEYLLTEVGDATLFLSVLSEITAEQLKMLTLVLPDVRAAGVGFQVLATSDADVFRWDDAWGTPEVWGTVRVI